MGELDAAEQEYTYASTTAKFRIAYGCRTIFYGEEDDGRVVSRWFRVLVLLKVMR